MKYCWQVTTDTNVHRFAFFQSCRNGLINELMGFIQMIYNSLYNNGTNHNLIITFAQNPVNIQRKEKNDRVITQSVDFFCCCFFFFFLNFGKSRNGIYLIAGNRLEASDFLAEVRQPNSVVENSISTVVVGVGTSDDTNDRKVLTVSAGDGVENAEPADSEGDNTCTDAAGPGVAVGGVASVELVTAANVVETRLGNDAIEKSEVEVSGNGEDVVDANLNKTVSDVAAEGGAGASGVGRRGRVLNGGNGAVLRSGTHVVIGGFA